MKRLLMVICCLILFIGCASVPVNAPTDCEKSVIYTKNKIYIDFGMSIAVTGVRSLSIAKPEYYALAHLAAIQAAALIRSKPVSLKDMMDNKLIDFYTPLLALIPMDHILCQADRDYIADHLLMI